MNVLPTFRRTLYYLSLVLLIIGSLAFFPGSVQSGNSVVGTGSSASCAEAAFDTVFNTVETSGGGTITFKCGLAPHTIIFTAQKSVSANTDINGGDLITLSGGNATSLFQVYSGQSMTISHLTLSRGYGTFGAVENFGSLNINSSQVVNNTATISGGAIANHNDLRLTNAVIANNTAAQFGGGIYTDAGITTIVNSQFKIIRPPQVVGPSLPSLG